MTDDQAGIRAAIVRLAGIPLDDGIEFDTGGIRTTTIREDADYAGTRVTMPASVARARIKISLDVNFGDPITPEPRLIELAQVLSPAPFTLLGYPVETIIAEKLTTAVTLGDANTRDRDYADLYRLITRHDLTGPTVADALRNTAAFRRVHLRPLAETLDTLVSRRQTSYVAWRRRQGPDQAAYPERFSDVVAAVTAFADPLLRDGPGPGSWNATHREWR